MSDTNSVNGTLETEKLMEAVVACTSDTNRPQREVASEGSYDITKPKSGKKKPASYTAEMWSTAPELKVECEKGKT